MHLFCLYFIALNEHETNNRLYAPEKIVYTFVNKKGEIVFCPYYTETETNTDTMTKTEAETRAELLLRLPLLPLLLLLTTTTTTTSSDTPHKDSDTDKNGAEDRVTEQNKELRHIRPSHQTNLG